VKYAKFKDAPYQMMSKYRSEINIVSAVYTVLTDLNEHLYKNIQRLNKCRVPSQKTDPKNVLSLFQYPTVSFEAKIFHSNTVNTKILLLLFMS